MQLFIYLIVHLIASTIGIERIIIASVIPSPFHVTPEIAPPRAVPYVRFVFNCRPTQLFESFGFCAVFQKAYG